MIESCWTTTLSFTAIGRACCTQNDDSLALVGSGNFDIRSFAINFELSLLSYGSQATAALRFLQQEYIEQSEELTAKAWSAERGRCGRLFDDTAKLFSPLL